MQQKVLKLAFLQFCFSLAFSYLSTTFIPPLPVVRSRPLWYEVILEKDIIYQPIIIDHFIEETNIHPVHLGLAAPKNNWDDPETWDPLPPNIEDIDNVSP